MKLCTTKFHVCTLSVVEISFTTQSTGTMRLWHYSYSHLTYLNSKSTAILLSRLTSSFERSICQASQTLCCT